MSGERDIYFLSKNYVSVDDAINVSSGDLLKSRLYDGRTAALWSSSGETTETDYNTYIEVIFYESTGAVQRTFDTIVLQNTNFKKFKVQYHNGSNYVDIAEATVESNASNTVRLKITTPLLTSRIKVLIQSTIVASQEKTLGELWFMLQTYQLQNPLTTRSRADELSGGFSRLGDGTGTQWREYDDKWHKVYSIKQLTDTQLLALKAIHAAHLKFSFYENYTRDVDSIMMVHWVGGFDCEDNPKVSMELNTLDMELVEQ